MNCTEFEQVLPEMFEDGRTPEQKSHLKSCPLCSGLVADLDLIAREARQLQETAEPNPRVWNSIEITLRQEGVIRDPHLGPLLVPSQPRRWSLAWLAPVAAILVVGFGISVYQKGSDPKLSAHLDTPSPAAVAQLPNSQKPSTVNNTEDDQLLAAVASRSPAMQAQYASNLQNVNAYIKDAEESAQADPNDEEAQQIVMDAYEQRAAVYEMALDRSLP
jgi:hypothetical protein